MIGDMLGEWLKSAISWLSEPLTSVVSNYATLLTRSLSGSSRQQSPRTDGIFQRLEEIFSVMGVASGEVGVASMTEHEMAVDVMSKDENGDINVALGRNVLTCLHFSVQVFKDCL